MPVVTAFKGTITVTGTTRNTANQLQTFYENQVSVYGETMGELLDNLVKMSVPVANDVFQWVLENKPATYQLGSPDCWDIDIMHPDLRSFVKGYSPIDESNSGGNLKSVEDIVHRVVADRTNSINFALISFRSSPETLLRHARYLDMYDETTLEGKTQVGLTGAEFDKLHEVFGQGEDLAFSELSGKNSVISVIMRLRHKTLFRGRATRLL